MLPNLYNFIEEQHIYLANFSELDAPPPPSGFVCLWFVLSICCSSRFEMFWSFECFGIFASFFFNICFLHISASANTVAFLFCNIFVALVCLCVFGLRPQTNKYIKHLSRSTKLIECCLFNAGKLWIYLFTVVDVRLLRTSACAAEIKYCALETRIWQAWTASRWHRYCFRCKNMQQ